MIIAIIIEKILKNIKMQFKIINYNKKIKMEIIGIRVKVKVEQKIILIIQKIIMMIFISLII